MNGQYCTLTSFRYLRQIFRKRTHACLAPSAKTLMSTFLRRTFELNLSNCARFITSVKLNFFILVADRPSRFMAIAFFFFFTDIVKYTLCTVRSKQTTWMLTFKFRIVFTRDVSAVDYSNLSNTFSAVILPSCRWLRQLWIDCLRHLLNNNKPPRLTCGLAYFLSVNSIMS